MSQTHSPSGGRLCGVQRVCRVWKVPRSTLYQQRKRIAAAAGLCASPRKQGGRGDESDPLALR